MGFRFTVTKLFIVLLISGLLPLQAAAITVPGSPVTIDESFNHLSQTGRFRVNNIATPDIFSFFVTNNTAASAIGYVSGGFLLPRVSAWDAAIKERTVWERWSFFDGVSSSWMPPNNSVLSWSNLFGDEFSRVIAYRVVDYASYVTDFPGPRNPTQAGQSAFQFFFESELPNSPFAVSGENVTVIEQGDTFVPFPAVVWLFGSGLIGLFGLKSRKQKFS